MVLNSQSSLLTHPPHSLGLQAYTTGPNSSNLSRTAADSELEEPCETRLPYLPSTVPLSKGGIVGHTLEPTDAYKS